jgi:DNA-binding NarL/FixJ family response regulator
MPTSIRVLLADDHTLFRDGLRAVAPGPGLSVAAIAQRLMNSFTRPRPAPPEAFPELTAREREVLDLIAHGCENQP